MTFKKIAIARRLDTIIATAIIVLVTWFTLTLSHSFDPALFEVYADNAWFQADVARTSSNMVEVSSEHYRTKIHPIVSLITLPATKVISMVWPSTRVELATRLIALVAGFWAAGLYLLCRLLRGSRWNALAFTLLGISTTSFIFFFSVPETFGLGSLTILVTLLLAAYLPRPVPTGAYIFASAASLSITITNWMAGIILAFTTLPRRKAVRVTILALLFVALLALVQKWFVPSSRLFFLGNREEMEYINPQGSGSMLTKLIALLLHSFAAPVPSVRAQVAPYWSILSMQLSPPGSGSSFGIPALAAWISLLFLGLMGAWKKWHLAAVKVIVLIVAGQIVLHLIYGDEAVLYTLHLMVALLALAMLAMYAPLGRYTTAMVSGLALLAATLAFANNMQVFKISTTHLSTALNQRDQVLKAMRERPQEIWPRGVGHVILARPGSALADKAYHEPGGSFSPAPGSFGASIWVTDKAGNFIASSETLPLSDIRQRFDLSRKAALALVTNTKYYTAEWSHDGTESTLLLTPTATSKELQLWLMLRSVGPAGGPITQAQAATDGLVLNGTWHIKPRDAFAKWKVADESTGKITPGSGPTASTDKSGWLYAAAMLDSQKPATITIQKTAVSPVPSQPAFPQLNTWIPLVPNPDFTESAAAQQANLLMGLTAGHTRPGDPMNYTHPWIRDAAYSVVALTKSGHLDSARQLAPEIAEHDFFGDFGAEADAPGLAIWALDELAQALSDPVFDAWLWPHVQRKALWIQACLAATKPVFAESQVQIDIRKPVRINHDRLCEPSREGLIVGRMDNGFPILFVNSTAYAGLEHAVRIAQRLGKKDSAIAYQRSADALKLAWQQEFMKPRMRKAKDALSHWPEFAQNIIRERRLGAIEHQLSIVRNWIGNNRNERLFAAAQWPAWIIGDSGSTKTSYIQALQQQWNATRNEQGEYRTRPLWTYFDFAQAHQWLLLGYPDQAWQTLNWFFRHQSSSGLYSWWEGNKEENSGHMWPTVRGWVKPTNVTPHYWTAAEALMLELDMLAYVDESKPQQPLMIGAGVPASWLSQPMDSGVIYTSRGPVRWTWKSHVLSIETTDTQLPVELGPAFRGVSISRIKYKPED